MPSRRLDYDDAYTTRFDAVVADLGVHHGRPAVELDATYFYPEGGGQEADRGTLGGVEVVDVQNEAGRVWHILHGAAFDSGARLAAEIDWTRRFDHMQQHTGQHVLSATLERELNAETLSSHLGETRSTIEVSLAEADWATIERVERVANRIVWENRPVMRHWVDDESVKQFKLRKAPKFTGSIRIVEIPDWDVSACGGTHTLRTGEVGLIKVVGWERVRGNVRFEFLCGVRALRDYAWRTETLLEAAKKRTLRDDELIAHLERAAGERDALHKRVQELTTHIVLAEAAADVGDPPHGVSRYWLERPREELRLYALKCLEAGAPWVAAGAAAPVPTLVLARARDRSEPNLRDWVPELIARSRGKGGGSPDLVTIAAADQAGAEACWRWASQALAETATLES